MWDIDGTLIVNTPTAGSLYLDAVEQVTGVRPTVRLGNSHGMTEGQLLAGILDVNDIEALHLAAVYERIEELSLLEHEAGHTRQACEGATEAMAAFAARGWINALLTGNGPNRARYKVLAAGYDAGAFDWQHSYFGHESPTRHHLTSDARLDLEGEHAIIIGDTPKDGEAADSAGIPFVAVATGTFAADELRETNAIVVIENFVTGLGEATDAIVSAIAQSNGLASARR